MVETSKEAKNIYLKMQEMRVALQKRGVKKTGDNTYSKYKYYTLDDIMPPINEIMLENNMTALVNFDRETATLTFINCDNPTETISFMSPMEAASLKGCHNIQNAGAVQTYQRRYLYMMAFEIAESDILDETKGSDKVEPPAKKLSQPKANILNNLIAELNSLYDDTSAATKLANALRKPLGSITDADFSTVKSLLDSWIEEEKLKNAQ